jgi:predicted  nucleic acid-binding Zn-ribbon protein
MAVFQQPAKGRQELPMKCPKCGYNSFEFNDKCPKCLNDLAGYKAAHGLMAMALPLTARTEMARSMEIEAPADHHSAEDADLSSDIFSFEFDENEQGAGQKVGGSGHDPFSFGGEPADSSPQAKDKEGPFTGFLETAPQMSAAAPAGKPAIANNEFDLKDFSWDDTPDPSGDGKPGKPREDGFGNLFGGAKK